MIILYAIALILFSLYSYVLVDPNITFFQNKWWENFRNYVVQIGYYQREQSWLIYLTLTLVLFLFYFYFLKKYQKYDPFKLAIIVGVILLASYPLLSHDLFNYMFDAKIFTYYHQNPYLHKALDFPGDPWLRFMHWTHRTYPYGPTFLPITFIPSFLSFGKFIFDFFLFKGMFVGFYLFAVYCLQKISRRSAMIFALHPFILIEGLINAHNDLIAVSLAIVGIYFLFKDGNNVILVAETSQKLPIGTIMKQIIEKFNFFQKKRSFTKQEVIARIFFILSAGIKYLTVPLIFLSNKNKIVNYVVCIMITLLLMYLTARSEIQPWYFLSLFAFLPLYEKLIHLLTLFMAGMLFSYYPYIALGGWDKPEKVAFKHDIILFFFITNLIYITLIYTSTKLPLKRFIKK